MRATRALFETPLQLSFGVGQQTHISVDRVPDEPSQSSWSAEYARRRHRHAQFTEELERLLRKLLATQGVRATLESRTKSVVSFEQKIARPGKAYSNPLAEISDLSGVRVVVTTLSDMKRVADLIAQELTIDSGRSINKAASLAPDQFGYLSQHFIVAIPSGRLAMTEWKEFGGLTAEIQVRTELQHTWSIVHHPLDYKAASDIPTLLRRRLFRLSALFELADQELDAIVRDAEQLRSEYASDSPKELEDIEINLDALKAYIDSSAEVAQWDKFWNSIPATRTEAPAWGPRDAQMPVACGIKTLGQYESLLHASHGWGEEFIERVLLSLRGSPTNAVSTTRNGILMYVLVGNFPDVLTIERLRNEFGFGRPEPTIELARQLNPRFK